MESKFDDLTIDDIEVRIATVKEKGVTLLLYKDARCDMRILDKNVGAGEWQRDHKELKGNIYCGISIWSEKKGIWVTKWDCGSESFTEKEKGEASDSFKRAGFNWGIGRELYTSPFIWIPSNLCNIEKDKNSKTVCYDRFEVKSIEIKDKKIVGLEITLNNKVVFSTKEKIKNTIENKKENKQENKQNDEIDIEDKIDFGKHTGKTWVELYSVDKLYFDWLINNAKTVEGAERYKKIRETIENMFLKVEE